MCVCTCCPLCQAQQHPAGTQRPQANPAARALLTGKAAPFSPSCIAECPNPCCREGLQAKAWKYRSVRKRDAAESPRAAAPLSSPRHHSLLGFRDEPTGPCHPPVQCPHTQGQTPNLQRCQHNRQWLQARNNTNPTSPAGEMVGQCWEREVQERPMSKKGPGSPS